MKIVILKDQKKNGYDSDFTNSDSELEINKEQYSTLSNEQISTKKLIKVLNRGGLRVFVFNVGQGSFNLIYEGKSKTLLIVDAGGSYNYNYQEFNPINIKFENKDIAYEKNPLNLINNLIRNDFVEKFNIYISHHDIDHYLLLYKIVNLLLTTLDPDSPVEWRIFVNPLIYERDQSSGNFYLKDYKDNMKELMKKYRLKTDLDYDNEIIENHFSVIPEGFTVEKFSTNENNQMSQELKIFRPTYEKVRESEKEGKEKKKNSREDFIFYNSSDISNSTSAIIKWQYNFDDINNFSVLFPGDANFLSLKYIRSAFPVPESLLRCHVLVANHHGADSLNDQGVDFWSDNIEFTNPIAIIYSSHRDSEYGHPRTSGASKVIAKLASKENTQYLPFHNINFGYQNKRNEDEKVVEKKFKISPVNPDTIKTIKEDKNYGPVKIREYITTSPLFHTGRQGSILISSHKPKVLRFRSYTVADEGNTLADITKDLFKIDKDDLIKKNIQKKTNSAETKSINAERRVEYLEDYDELDSHRKSPNKNIFLEGNKVVPSKSEVANTLNISEENVNMVNTNISLKDSKKSSPEKKTLFSTFSSKKDTSFTRGEKKVGFTNDLLYRYQIKSEREANKKTSDVKQKKFEKAYNEKF